MARFSKFEVEDRAEAFAKADLDGVGLPSEIPEIKPAGPPPQVEFEYDDLEYVDR